MIGEENYMEVIRNSEFGGERPLFESHNLRLENVIIRAGESAIKECSNIEAVDCRFEGNYPFWHVHGFKIERCYFDVGGRSALWYSDHLQMKDTVIDAPKMFREMSEIDIENVTMNDADEVFWRCNGIRIKNLKYFGSQPWPYPSGIMVGYYAEYESGTIKLQDEELSAGAFYHRDHLPEIPKKLSIARKLIDAWLNNEI